MIQRKQTLFLLAVAIIAISLFFVPLFNYNGDTHSGTFNLTTSEGVSNVYYPIIINIIVLILSIGLIFLYKNRVLQYKLSTLLALFNVFITGLLFILPFQAILTEIEVTFWAFLPIISAVFAFLAGHFIKKDEQLVRSADRIR